MNLIKSLAICLAFLIVAVNGKKSSSLLHRQCDCVKRRTFSRNSSPRLLPAPAASASAHPPSCLVLSFLQATMKSLRTASFRAAPPKEAGDSVSCRRSATAAWLSAADSLAACRLASGHSTSSRQSDGVMSGKFGSALLPLHLPSS